MGKLLFWVGVGLGALIVARLLAYKAAGKKIFPIGGKQQARHAPASAAKDSPESMIRCAHCGVHLPRSDATLIGEETWCSPAHAQLCACNIT